MLVSVKRALLIVNPYSTHVTGRRITEVENALRERVELETEFTRHPGHATELAAAAADDDVDAILVFSGDGTYNEALNGIDGRLPIGFVPGGGTSVLPRALGIPRDAVAAARVLGAALDDGRLRRISVGAVNGRRFSFSAGIGFDAEAVRKLDALGRDSGGARPGDTVFLRMVLKMLLERRGRWAPALEIEGVGRAAFVLVANGDPYSYAGAVPIRITPGARFEDGLAFAAPREVRRRDVPRLATAIVRGRGYGPQILTGVDLDRIDVHCDAPLPLQADGEDLGDVEQATFEARRDAVSVLV
ncbi:MAG TPA: diacylglycerol kinase family protein [Gaiellaceae bacterium]|nr:diacylglycerol kinase family protein [Gaiellaceae bacterium]